MNRILIIHLKRYGDLISAGQTLSSLKSIHPHAEISLLCFEEFAKVTRLIPGIKHTHTISRDTLLTLKNGKLYNTGFALEELRVKLSPLLEKAWDKVVNLTNDTATAHLCSWIGSHNNNTHITGMKIDENGLAIASNSWATVFNDILPRAYNNSPFNFRDVWAKMLGISDIGASNLLVNTRNEETVQRNFATLRGQEAKVIGIQATCSVSDKGLGIEVVASLTKQLKSLGHQPVLLIAANDNERALANEVIENLDFQPIVIESDFTALSSVIKNLDLVITPDTVTKHFADAQNTSCVEVSLGSSPVFKQATVNPKSLLLVAPDRALRKINVNDIINASTYVLSSGSGPLEISSDFNAYRPVQVEGITSYQICSATLNQRQEFNRHALSALLLKINNRTSDFVDDYALMAIRSASDTKSFSSWIEETKSQANMATKDLLHSIRSLLQMRENPRKSSEFVQSLEKLFAYTDELLPSNVGIHFFQARIESLPPASFKENARAIEALLFELKADLQSSVNLLSEWESLWNESKFEARKQRKSLPEQETV